MKYGSDISGYALVKKRAVSFILFKTWLRNKDKWPDYTAAFNGQNLLFQFFGCYVVFMKIVLCNLNDELDPKKA